MVQHQVQVQQVAKVVQEILHHVQMDNTNMVSHVKIVLQEAIVQMEQEHIVQLESIKILQANQLVKAVLMVKHQKLVQQNVQVQAQLVQMENTNMEQCV